MSILNQEPIVQSDAIKLQNITRRIKGMTADTYQQLVNRQKDGIDVIWNNPNFEPQTILNALSGDAGKVFQYHGELTEFIVAVATTEGVVPDIKLPSNAFTVNPNGTVTVLSGAYIA